MAVKANDEDVVMSVRSDQAPMVWYASFGSNMNYDRFMCYIAGGRPEGGNLVNQGCTDTTPPATAIPFELPYSLYFAGESLTWGGGVALLETASTGESTKAKAYLITRKQFEEVTAQEGGVKAVPPLDMDRLRVQGHLPTGANSQRYNEYIYCGEHDGYPVVSFTNAVPLRPYAKPSAAYLKMIGRGLTATHNLSVQATAQYLGTIPGVVGNYSRAELEEILE